VRSHTSRAINGWQCASLPLGLVVNRGMLWFISSSALLAAATSQPVQSPRERAERVTILNQLRGPLEAKFGGPIEFVVTTFRTNSRWVFVQAEPRRPGGRLIDGRGYYGADWENMDGLTTTAILQKVGAAWEIKELRVGATDAWYCGFISPKLFDPCGGYRGD
jgi:hypothetical protein